MAWKNALSLAPTLVEKGRAIWETVGSRRPAITVPAPHEPIRAEIRLPALERRIGQLGGGAGLVRSDELDRATAIAAAEQHAELVQVAEVLLQRTRVL